MTLAENLVSISPVMPAPAGGGTFGYISQSPRLGVILPGAVLGSGHNWAARLSMISNDFGPSSLLIVAPHFLVSDSYESTEVAF